MNAPIDPKSVKPVSVTTGSLPGSRKAYAEAQNGVKVPFGEIALHESSGEPPFRVYDTSGPYSDDGAKIDVYAGLPRTREPWVQARGTEQYAGRAVKPEDNGNVGATHAAREFPLRYQAYRGQHPSPQPSPNGRGSPVVPVVLASPLPEGEGQGEGLQPLTQLEFARAGIVTEEMIYIAHRENLGRAAALDRA